MSETRAEIVYRRTYSRPIDEDNGVFESFEETIDRVIGHQRWLWERALERKLSGKEEEELEELRQIMLNKEAEVSGRTMWLGGTEVAARREASQFNCAFERIETVHDVVDALWLLLQGCGVGFRPVPGTLNGFARYIPEVEIIRSERTEKGPEANKEKFENGVWTIEFGDSAEAWAKAFGKIMAGKNKADKLVLDLRNIRPAGTRLKSYGWIGSGDHQLAEALQRLTDLMNERAGQLLTAVDILDVTNILGTILSSRRSAEIAVLPYEHAEWEDFAEAKKDFWKPEVDKPYRASSNNSLLFYQQPTRWELKRLFDKMLDNGGSEPGFFNAAKASEKTPYFQGTNPCQPGFATVLTPEGIKTFDDIDKGSTIWSGDAWTTVVDKWNTGTKPVYKYKTTRGYFIGTENHRVVEDGSKVEVAEAEKIDSIDGPKAKRQNLDPQDIMDGLVIGDGSWHEASNREYLCIGENDHDYFKSEVAPLIRGANSISMYYGYDVETTITKGDLVYTYERRVPDRFFFADDRTKMGFLRGLFSANGFVVAQGKRVGLKATSKEIIEQVQEMLSSLGIGSYITTNKAKSNEFSNGTYQMKESYDLNVTVDRAEFLDKIGFLQEYKNRKIDKIDATAGKKKRNSFSAIKDVEYLGEFEVYDITVDDTDHVYWTGGCLVSNCGEAHLGNRSFCNLVETNLSKFNGRWDDLLRKHYLIARANYRQTAVDLDDGILQRSWHELNQFLRLTGVGATGIVQWEHENSDDAWYELWKAARAGVDSMAEELDLPYSKASSLIKPSGTMAKVMNTTEGIHRPLGKYIFNNIMFSSDDPLVEKLRAANYRIMDHPYQQKSVLVTFPISYEDVEFSKVVTDNDRIVEVNLESAVDQLERYKRIQENYAEHNVSITVSYDPEEVPAIVDWLMDNWHSYVGVSFLLRNDPTKTAEDLGYPYLPQEVVTKEEFDAYVSQLGEVEFADRDSGHELGEDEYSCSTGACPVK